MGGTVERRLEVGKPDVRRLEGGLEKEDKKGELVERNGD
jgi:hypothetical protein